MKKMIAYLWILLMGGNAFGQGQNNIWTFGNHYSLDFNQNPPLLRDTTYVNGTEYQSQNVTTMYPSEHKYNYAQAVCDDNGALRFLVKRYTYSRNGNLTPCIFDNNEVPIAGTEFLPSNDMEYSRPVIIPNPANGDQYYIFYVRNGGLIYCLFDLSLNNGRGDIVPGHKNKLLYSYNSLVGPRMVAITGCDGIWLVIRHKTYNQYLSFKITAAGVATSPVVSEIGSFPIGNYRSDYGVLASSPNGRMIAASFVKANGSDYLGGIELFDFEKCSGKLQFARTIDLGQTVHGLSFSPDNSKLYGGYAIQWANGEWKFDQYIYQFDLNQSSLLAITASKTLILTNPYAFHNSTFCPLTTNIIGNLNIGPDGKLYMSNSHPGVCPGTGPGMALHVINKPNLLGLLCDPQVNVIWNQWNGMGNDYGACDMPNSLVSPPPIEVDTISGNASYSTVCFKSDTMLTVSSKLSCLRWDNGSTDTSRQITENGTYLLYYVKDCSVYVDSYFVNFVPLPKLEQQQYGCPGNISLQVGGANGTFYSYTLTNADGLVINADESDSVFVTTGLEEGLYTLQINTDGGCTAKLEIHLSAYPKPEVSIEPTYAEISYGSNVSLKANGATYYVWSPVTPLDNSYQSQVLAAPKETTTFKVVGINDYGCQDTAFAKVIVSADDRVIIPNAFTPNGDGLNDRFKVPGTHFTIRKFEVYNRYGQLLFQDNGSNNGWDGTFQGKPCEQGVYHYSIVLDFNNGTQKNVNGDFTLIR
jgi:gliding motility-associated-like protein